MAGFAYDYDMRWRVDEVDWFGSRIHQSTDRPRPPPKTKKQVQVASLKACAALLMHLVTEDAGALFQDLVPGMLQVARACLEQGEE